METAAVSWAAINPGDAILSKDGGTQFNVVQFNHTRTQVQVSIVGTSKLSSFPINPLGTVTRMQNSTFADVDDMAVAEAVAMVGLGAQVVARDEDGVNYCPGEYDHIGAFQAHLHVMHGFPGKELSDDMSRLRQLHDGDHKSPAHKERGAQHIHDNARFRKGY